MNREQSMPVPWSLQTAICEKVVLVRHDENASSMIPTVIARDISSIVVVQDDSPVGVVKTSELKLATNGATLADLSRPIGWVHTTSGRPLSDGAQLFQDETVELIALYDSREHLIGMVTRDSLALAALRESEVLRQVISNEQKKVVQGNLKESADTSQEDVTKPSGEPDGQTTPPEIRETLYQAILEAQPECVKVLDRDGRVLEMNPAGVRMIEADNFEQVRGVKISEILPPEYQELYRKWERQVFTGEKATIVFEADGLKGTRKWLEAIGTPLRNSSGEIEALLAVTRDITNRVVAEKRLRENEQRLRNIFNGLPYYLTLFSVDGSLSLVNHTTFDSPGFSSDQLQGLKIWETEWIRFDPVVQERIRHAFFQAQQGLNSRFDSPIRMVTGEMKQFEITVHPVCDEKGTVREILGAGVDITARVEAEAQAQRFREEIAHATRLSTLGEMAANIAHELSQPLAAIVNYAFTAQVLLDTVEGEEKQRCAKYLDAIEAQSMRVGQIVSSVQQLVRKTKTEHAAVDLVQILNDVLSLIKSDLYHERIELITNIPSNLPLIQVDSVQIQQVLLNLLRNSIEALSGVDTVRRIEITTERQDHRILVTIQDTGMGISYSPTDKAFDAFVSSKPGGLGLGLTISRRIIDIHGGELRYESAAGFGAIFSFTLPISHFQETDE
ncbi:MAG: PAS domain S-box protein [Planctomycetota bacterium]|nr:PAS domain S-box protein [Planctomycetota bacterium]MDA1211916.1 PAS domain S-box protein [Planctomycetota bacterium]